HRLGAVRRRAGARLRQAVHQGARPLQGARRRERVQGGGESDPVGAAEGDRRVALQVRKSAFGRLMAREKVKEKEKRKPIAPGGPSLLAAAPPPPPPAHVYRWDLDKTYLKTEFDTLKDLLRSAFEGAEANQAVPGAAALLRELRAGGKARICFISGSPRQMRRVLTKKLRLDGVEFDEFILKPNLRNMLTGRWAAMREQVGYKLPALLAGRAGLPADVRETCFGDDAEADCFIYSLYADVIGGSVDRPMLEEILHRAGCYPEDAQRAVALAEALPAPRK